MFLEGLRPAAAADNTYANLTRKRKYKQRLTGDYLRTSVASFAKHHLVLKQLSEMCTMDSHCPRTSLSFFWQTSHLLQSLHNQAYE